MLQLKINEVLSIHRYTIFATHMEAMTELATIYPNVKISHFDVDVKNNRLNFKVTPVLFLVLCQCLQLERFPHRFLSNRLLVSTKGWPTTYTPLWPTTSRSGRASKLGDHNGQKYHIKDYRKGPLTISADIGLILLQLRTFLCLCG